MNGLPYLFDNNSQDMLYFLGLENSYVVTPWAFN
jgi:hypothetical protein